MEITRETLDVIFDALEQLRSLGQQMEVVVIDGSAPTALGLVSGQPGTLTCLRSPKTANSAQPSRCRRRGIASHTTSNWMRTG
jgi:hypothetical protein